MRCGARVPGMPSKGVAFAGCVGGVRLRRSCAAEPGFWVRRQKAWFLPAAWGWDAPSALMRGGAPCFGYAVKKRGLSAIAGGLGICNMLNQRDGLDEELRTVGAGTDQNLHGSRFEHRCQLTIQKAQFGGGQ
jgi:hypothetical protein